MLSTSPNISPAEEKAPHPLQDTALWDAGGATGTRTPDPLLAKQMLSQLSYRPKPMQNAICKRSKTFAFYILHFAFLWWAWVDSNHRPPSYQDGALTS